MADTNGKVQEIISELSHTRIFSHLNKETLEEIAALGKIRTYAKGSVILEEGQVNHDIYFLLKGTVLIYSQGKFVGKQNRAGDIFGEVSVVSDGPISATVIAKDEVETVLIDGNIIGGFRSEKNSELVTVFYKLFSLSLLEKLKLSTTKARVFEDALRHVPSEELVDNNEIVERTEEQLLNNTLLTSIGVHTAEQAIMVVDINGDIVRLNLAAESLFDCIETDMVSSPLRSLCDSDSYDSIYAKLLDGGISSWTGELAYLTPSGKRFPAKVSLSAIQEPGGPPIGVFSIITAISKQ